MIDYEILLLLDPDLAEEPQAEVVTRVRDLIEKGGGTFTRHDAWGKRKLAYEIDKKATATTTCCSSPRLRRRSTRSPAC